MKEHQIGRAWESANIGSEVDYILEPLILPEKVLVLEIITFLKQRGGEWWACGETLERCLALLALEAPQ